MKRAIPFLIAIIIAGAVAFFVQGYYLDESFTMQSVFEKYSSASATAQ